MHYYHRFTKERTKIQVKQNYLASSTQALLLTEDPRPGLIYISDSALVYHHEDPAHSPAHSLLGAPSIRPTPRFMWNPLSASGSYSFPRGPQASLGDEHVFTPGLPKKGGQAAATNRPHPMALEGPRKRTRAKAMRNA